MISFLNWIIAVRSGGKVFPRRIFGWLRASSALGEVLDVAVLAEAGTDYFAN